MGWAQQSPQPYAGTPLASYSTAGTGAQRSPCPVPSHPAAPSPGAALSQGSARSRDSAPQPAMNPAQERPQTKIAGLSQGGAPPEPGGGGCAKPCPALAGVSCGSGPVPAAKGLRAQFVATDRRQLCRATQTKIFGSAARCIHHQVSPLSLRPAGDGLQRAKRWQKAQQHGWQRGLQQGKSACPAAQKHADTSPNCANIRAHFPAFQ